MIRMSLVFVVSSILYMTGCSNFKVDNDRMMQAEAYKSVKLDNISPAEAIFQATEAIKIAKEEGLEFYSPLHIKRAQQKITKANALLRFRTTKRSRIAAATEALVAIKVIDAAKANKQKVESELSVILDQKKVLDDMGAMNHLRENYLIGMGKVSQLIENFERRKVERVAFLEKETLEYLNKLEANTLKITSLMSVKDMLVKAKSIRARKYATATYKNAIEDYKKAIVFIDVNYKDREAVDMMAKKTYASASHAFYVALEAHKIIHSDAAGTESYILDIQQYLSYINKQLGIEDLHSHPFKKQASLIHDKISAKVLEASIPKAVEETTPVVAGAVQVSTEASAYSADTVKKSHANEVIGRDISSQDNKSLAVVGSHPVESDVLIQVKDTLVLDERAALKGGDRPLMEEDKSKAYFEEVVEEMTVVTRVID